MTSQVNKTLPLNYDFEFVVEEITNVNDKGEPIPHRRRQDPNLRPLLIPTTGANPTTFEFTTRTPAL
jgi:hypothetical protein